ncbi:hypothetical protein [Microbacterium sp. MPKO10]|uniref:hypothetical protein n=1 Tax=Microbacterium sp. MPKO10 TaxID=2989818 RepID=UPI0022366398|nr:hypothetical protein [Microbacterium sp. MPKO10]MCW4458194.1 hypothetical protein [Microbacterium sp. MPKO10]
MTLRNSFPTDLPAGLPVLDTRLALATLIARDTDGVPRVGVVPDSLDPIVSGRSTMSYSVRDHRAVTSRTGTGVEYLANDGATVVNTTPAPSANARYDIIYERARFALNGDGDSTPEIDVVQGTAALNPTRPGIPAGAVAIAEAYVPSGVSSTTSSGVVITQVHPWTAAAGGTVVVRSQAELDTWTPADGAHAYNLADSGDYVRRAGAWDPVRKAQPWTNIQYPSYAQQGPLSFALGYMLEPGFLNLRGSYQRTSGSPVSAGEQLFQLPSSVANQMTNRQTFIVGGQGNASLFCEYDAANNWVKARGDISGSATWVVFDNVRLALGG